MGRRSLRAGALTTPQVSILFVGQLQTRQPGGLQALQSDSETRVSVADLGITETVERQEHRCSAFWPIDGTAANQR